MAVRIISGDLKGRKLRSASGKKTRPTANRTREAIFNILASEIPGTRVLDLFAGTGAFGIEALSRKADFAVFIDINIDAVNLLHANLKNLALERRTKILQWDVTKNLNCLHPLSTTFDLVFMDPPYNMNMIKATLRNLHLSKSLTTGAQIIIEHSRREPVSSTQLPFATAIQRNYGKALVTILEYVI